MKKPSPKEKFLSKNNPKLWFTADTHFNHLNILKYCQRSFKNISEMNEILVYNWNNVVGKDDLVYHLGDFGFGKLENILNRLKGRKILIIGSHDKDTLNYTEHFENIHHLLEIKNKEYYITLCHYAMRVWPRSHFNSWHLYGHSHNRLESWGKSFDVGVDGNNFQLWSLDDVVKKMKTLPDNFNLVK